MLDEVRKKLEELKKLEKAILAIETVSKMETVEDCISRKEAIDKICDAMDPPHQCGTTDEEKALKRGLAMQWNRDWSIVNRILDKLPSVTPKQKWIPVSKGLPESECGESDSVLCCFENGKCDVLYFNGGNWCYPTGETYISVNHQTGWHNRVVAWMLLPDPYTEDE